MQIFEPPRSKDAYSAMLDFIRWFAAFLVVLAHVRHLHFVDYKNVAHLHSLFLKGFYFVTGFGHEAVVIFFVLSGFLVGGGALQKLSQQRFQLGDYFVSRFSRIYTVLLPALLLGGLVDIVGSQYFNLSEIYTNVQQYNIGSMNTIIANNLTWSIFWGNLLNLQNIVVPRLGSNQPLWSLANEWWYYVVFGLLVEAFRLKSRAWLGSLVAIIALAIFLLLPINIQLWFSIWMLGVLAGVVSFKRLHLPAWVPALLIIVALGFSRLSHSDDAATTNMLVDLLRDILLALVFCFSIVALKKGSFRFPFENAQRELANFSYSLYLLHFPLLVFITAVLHDVAGKAFFVTPGMDRFVWSGLIIVLLYFSAWIFARCTEYYYHDFSKLLKRSLYGKPVK